MSCGVVCLLLLFSLVVILCVDVLHLMLRVVADMCCDVVVNVCGALCWYCLLLWYACVEVCCLVLLDDVYVLFVVVC